MAPDRLSRTQSRRRFLTATGSVALASAVAGCTGGDGGADTPTDSPTPADTTFEPPSSYPYGAGETLVGEAKRVMEAAGYGPDNRFELPWVQYTSPSWLEMANTIRARLESAYIDMSINEATFSELLQTTEKGNHRSYTLGWIMDYPRPQNFVQLIDPPNTVYDNPDIQPNGARLFWSEDAQVDPAVTEFQTAQFDRIQDNPQLTDEARNVRQDAAVKMEEGNWAAAGLIPVYHRFDEVFWYDRVDYRMFGGAGSSRAKASRSVRSLQGSQTLQGISPTFNSLDPIASGNTTSGAKIMNMFDAPMNYLNGTTEVVELLVEDFEVSDDLRTYDFTLKQGVQFHGDWGELTADDMVYSIRRLVESDNSTNTYFPISVLAIDHETTEGGGVVPGSTAVEKTGDYSFRIQLQEPFAYALEVLCYSAFSAVPEGIVGDVEGYDGEISYQEFSTANPVGTGPFIFETWESGTGGEFRAVTNEDYHDGVANFDAIHSAIIEDADAAYNYALNQNADVFAIPTAKYDPAKVSVERELDRGRVQGTYGPLENGQTVNYGGVPTINTFYIGFNMEVVPQAVREAMAYVINQDEFVQSVFKGRGAAAYHLMPPALFDGGQQAYDAHYQG